MLAPGALGGLIDRQLGTSIFTPAGFLLGLALAMVALVILAKKLAPPARGKPIPFEDELPADKGES